MAFDFNMFIDVSTIVQICKMQGFTPDINLVQGFVTAIVTSAEKYGINTPQRLSAFIGQCVHESGGFRYFTEIGGINKKYAPYYGRGPIQVTHGYHYEPASTFIFGDDRGFKTPNLFNDPINGTLLAMWWWKENKVNAKADTGNTNEVSKKVNSKDTETFAKRANYTSDTINIFQKKLYDVKFKNSPKAMQLTLWNYLKLLTGLRKK